jgi:hypothetical protein
MTTTAQIPTRVTRRTAWILITVAGFALAMISGPQGPLGGFWGAPTAEDLGITGGLAGGYVAYGLVEATAFGLGLAWILLGRHYLTANRFGTVAWLSIGWALLSWYPHGGFHQSLEHDNMGGLLAIEYGFHATMIVAAVVIALYVIRTSRHGAES